MDKEIIINESIAEIKEVLGILKSQISLIDDKGYSIKETRTDPVSEEVRATVLYTQRSYLDFYYKIIEFIYNKLKDGEPDENFFFYIPQLRTLIEIYAYMLYLCFKDENKQMTVIISKTLSTVARANSGYKSEDVKKQYDLQYLRFKPFIDRENLTFPENIKYFSSKRLKNTGYDYPPIDQLLKEEWVKSSSPQISPYIRDVNETPYYIYGQLSNYVHGNFLNKDTHGNEKFWIISEVLVQSIRMAELISIKILNGSQRNAIANLLKRMHRNHPKFKDIWMEHSNKISKIKKLNK